LARLVGLDVEHHILDLYTEIGVFSIDRYTDSIDISLRTNEQFLNFISKENGECNPYFYSKCELMETHASDRTMHEMLLVLEEEWNVP